MIKSSSPSSKTRETPTTNPRTDPKPGSDLGEIRRMLPKVLARDRLAVIERVERLEGDGRSAHRNIRPELRRIRQRLERSFRIRRQREADRPHPGLLPDLPITARRNEIVRAIRNHQVVIVSGETGSGKTTQLPKFCLEAGRGMDGWIGCTQPRRIAASSVAQRLADEFGEPLGKSVGYKIRFQDRTPPSAYVKIMTDGILLAETQGDPLLSRYDTLIVDEAHERTLNIDFVLGIVRNLLRRRSDLKLIITSATIDTEKFSRAFDGAPIIEVSGRMFPVEIRYRPIEAFEGEEMTPVEAATQAVGELASEGARGDMLVFMPTEQDIRETCDLLESRALPRTVVLPLYARLPAGDQRRVFAGSAQRKIIVATNVAETSITIPGIRYVVDTGLARVPQYSPRTRTTGLPVVGISRSSADQRAGRCGRVADGVCVRLYSEEDYQGRPRFTPPEILRSSLAEVILRMIALDLGDVAGFPFIDPPDARSIKDGLDLLSELGAVRKEAAGSDVARPFRLSARGRIMARMPIDPRLSRMLVEANREGCLEEMTIIASALSIQDPRERPAESAQAADQAHVRFKDPDSDFVALLNIWNAFHDRRTSEKTTGGLKRFCRESFLSFRRMREWRDIHAQLTQTLEDADLGAPGSRPAAAAESGGERFGALYGALHRSVLSGFLSNIAVKKEKNIYRAGKGREAMIFPGSGLFNRADDWIVAAEMVETSRLFARTAAHIDPGWIESLAGDLCRRTFLEPRWERKRGAVVASEQVTVFGLVIEPGRPVLYGSIDPEQAADIFVRGALVEEDVRKPLPFMVHNRRLVDRVLDLEDRLRRRGIFAGEEAMFSFYRERLDGIWDIRSLNRLIRTRGDGFLRMTEADLLREAPEEDELALYPDRVALGSSIFPVAYRFEPGASEDGLTVSIPAPAAEHIDPRAADWLVPGLLREKLAALIRGLPKRYRRALVPVGDTVDLILKEMPREDGPLVSGLGRFLHRRFGLDIPADAWPVDQLPDHLKMRFVVLDDEGRELQAVRDPSRILRPVSEHFSGPPRLQSVRRQWERFDLTEWNFGDLPESVACEGDDGVKWILFPGLEAAPEGDRVHLRLFEGSGPALSSHRAGVGLLYRLRFAREIRMARRQVTLPAPLAARVTYPGGAKAMEDRVLDRAFRDLFDRNIRTAERFDRHGKEAIPGLLPDTRRWLDAAGPVIDAVETVRAELSRLGAANAGNPYLLALLQRLSDALLKLVPGHFVDIYGRDRLPHLVRYARAMGIRARRAVDHPDKDGAKASDIEPLETALHRLVAGIDERTTPEKRDAIEQLFWWIEEFKVSIFAQELGTTERVSLKRIRERIGEIGRMV
ncbi:MAG: ATP-dependent RNA helicase HrpA [Desulfobacterales bacterium]